MYLLVLERPNPVRPSAAAAELRALGHMVDPVADVRQAVARVSIEPFEAIVIDLGHGVESGLLALHEIRESNREIPILALFAQDQIHDRVTALIQGADDYLARPFTLAELQARLESLAPRDRGPNGPALAARAPAHIDRLIDSLVELGDDSDPAIGLVISEVKLRKLLERVCAALRPSARQKDIRLRIPRERLPTLLIDARWMEYLLSYLLLNAITECPGGAEISIYVDCDDEHCALEVECDGGPKLDLSLIRSYANHLRLRLEPPAHGSGIRVSNLRRV